MSELGLVEPTPVQLRRGMIRTSLAIGTLAIILAGCGSHAAAGSFDTSFGKNGRSLTTGFDSTDAASTNTVAFQPDGKIVVVGTGPSLVSGHADFAVARYTADGTLDTSFGTDGKVLTDFGRREYANAVAIQPDGKIVVAGTGYGKPGQKSDFEVARYTTGGALDTTFGAGGKVRSRFGSRSSDASAVAIAPDGKIVVAGTSDPLGNERFALARFAANGTLDRGFGTGGTVLTGFGSFATGVAVQADGKIVVVGLGGSGDNDALPPTSNAFADSSDAFALARFTTSGNPDPSFGKGGKVLTLFGFRTSSADAVTIQKDGKIVVAGDAGGFAVARYRTSGALDAGFSTDGKVVTDIGKGDVVAVAIEADGKIDVARTESADNAGGFSFVGYTASGALDTDGRVRTGSWLEAVAIQPDGKIVLAGSGASKGFVLGRYVP